MSVSEIAVATYLRIADKFQALREDEKGVTAVEYGVIAALIIVVCIAAIGNVGTALNTAWGTIEAAL